MTVYRCENCGIINIFNAVYCSACGYDNGSDTWVGDSTVLPLDILAPYYNRRRGQAKQGTEGARSNQDAIIAQDHIEPWDDE